LIHNDLNYVPVLVSQGLITSDPKWLPVIIFIGLLYYRETPVALCYWTSVCTWEVQMWWSDRL